MRGFVYGFAFAIDEGSYGHLAYVAFRCEVFEDFADFEVVSLLYFEGFSFFFCFEDESYEVIGLFGLGVVVFLGGLVRVLECEGCGVRAVGVFFEFFSPFGAYFVVFAFFVVCVDGFSVSGKENDIKFL